MDKSIIQKVRKTLIENADKKVKKSQKRFFKDEIKSYGVNVWRAEKIGKDYLKTLNGLSKKEIFALCEELLKSNFMEESWMAASWAYSQRKNYLPPDFAVFENWVKKYVTNWATCDTLCNHTIGTFIDMYPQYVEKLKAWTKSNNRWVKRAAAVTLIIPAKQGKFLKDIFEIADSLLKDTDDMVQKGYGWMLKLASQSHQKKVFEFVLKNKKVMPRTALRYAIEKLPPEFRQKAMEKN